MIFRLSLITKFTKKDPTKISISEFVKSNRIVEMAMSQLGHLNERLAVYFERVRSLEMENSQLVQQVL